MAKKKSNKKTNKKIKLFIIIGSVLVAIFIVGILYILVFRNPPKVDSHFIYMGEFPERINYVLNPTPDPYDDYKVLTTYDEYKEYFSTDELTKDDFKNNNYVVLPIIYDTCSEYDVIPTDYEIDGKNITVTIEFKSACPSCASEWIYYLLKVDKSMISVNVDINYKKINHDICYTNVEKKPIIYIYPTETTNVSVKLGNPEKLTVSYPKYENSWDVTAYPDGTLIDNKTGREHYGLYWEGRSHNTKVEKDGFIVKGEDITSFFEEKLSILGLTEKEADEFIIYWLPELKQNEYNYIRFETMDEINSYMPLEITPSPDTLIRIVMNYKPLDEPISIQEEKLEKVERKGYTVVEWGGSLIEN